MHIPRLRQISLRHLTWVLLIYLGIVAAAWPRRTYDIWWHIATGKWILQNGQVPRVDPFTWTREGTPWTAHGWAWDVPMFLFYSNWGHDGLMVLRMLVAAVACGLLAWLLFRRGAAPMAAMTAGTLAILAARPLFNDRPQALTLVFFVAMLCLIEQAERGKQRWLLIGAPLLMIPWVNFHGGFIYGPALIGLYALCKVPDWYRQWRGDEVLSPCPGFVLGAIALAAVACLANPNGVSGAVYPLTYISGGHSQAVISEYNSPDFSSATFRLLGYLIVVTTAVFAASGRRSGVWELALTAIFLYTALQWQRNTALFSFAIAPVLAMHLTEAMARWNLSGQSEESGSRPPSFLYPAIILALAVSTAFAIPSAGARAEAAFRGDMPVRCVEYVKQSGLQGRVFNTYRWGGYLIWHLWPEHKVMVDGRADVLGPELISDWRRAHRLEDGWQEVLDDYAVDWAIIAADAPLVRALELHPDWRLVCEEPTGSLFVRRGSIADRTADPAVSYDD
ncbi:MAG: hypothetical protein ACOX9R_01650 [Armatimonadota bacterium]|jgi:hypothetical protein